MLAWTATTTPSPRVSEHYSCSPATVTEVGGGAVDDLPGGWHPNGCRLEYHPGVPSPGAAFLIGVEVIDELAGTWHGPDSCWLSMSGGWPSSALSLSTHLRSPTSQLLHHLPLDKCVEPAGPDPARVAPQPPWRLRSAWPPAKCRCAGLFGALLTASIVSDAGLWMWPMPGRRTGTVLVGRHLSFR
jgi:hypothetical protein